jgi:hypothetical protein
MEGYTEQLGKSGYQQAELAIGKPPNFGGKLPMKELLVCCSRPLTSYVTAVSAVAALESARTATSAAKQLAGSIVRPAILKSSAAPRAR